MYLKFLSKSQNNKLDREFQAPSTGKLKPRYEHTYKPGTMTGHKFMKKFGGGGYRGEQPTSKHVLDLSNRTKALKSKMK